MRHRRLKGWMFQQQVKSHLLGLKWVFKQPDLQIVGLKLNKYE